MTGKHANIHGIYGSSMAMHFRGRLIQEILPHVTGQIIPFILKGILWPQVVTEGIHFHGNIKSLLMQNPFSPLSATKTLSFFVS